MQRRRLGTSTLEVSALGLGCMAMTTLYGPVDEAEAIATVREALDAGADFLDTSDAYADGKNEELLRRALADGYRAKAVLATKFGNIRLPDGKPGANGRPEYVIEACDKSLGRLGVEVIFGLCGHTVIAFLDALRGSRIKFISTRHEQVAAHAWQEVVALEGGLHGQRIDEVKARLWTEGHGDRHRTV